jgi:MoaD family protein
VNKTKRGEQQTAYNTIRVRYFAMLRDLVGRKDDELQLRAGATVSDAIAALVERHGGRFKEFVLTTDGQLRPRLTVLVNGEVVGPAEFGQTLPPEGSELVIMPPIGGGGSIAWLTARRRARAAGSSSVGDPMSVLTRMFAAALR